MKKKSLRQKNKKKKRKKRKKEKAGRGGGAREKNDQVYKYLNHPYSNGILYKSRF